MPRRNEPTERMCAVTREVRPTAELLRFVADPEGRLVLDLKHRLPGRGIWITARADIVGKAATKNVFARGLKAPASPGEDLVTHVADQLRRGVLEALSLARKGGALVTGFDAVDAAIAKGGIAALIHAAEAGEDGVAKLSAALRRHAGRGAEVQVLRRLSQSELSLALGRPHVIHAALLAGRAGRLALDRIDQLARFCDEAPGGALRPSSMRADETAQRSP